MSKNVEIIAPSIADPSQIKPASNNGFPSNNASEKIPAPGTFRPTPR